jgi:hypothetical protein
MKVYTTNSAGAGFVDVTTSAKSRSGSTFNVFQGTAAGHICYIGSEDPRQFYGIKADVNTAMVVGSGALVWEYWNGSTWTTLNVFASKADTPYTSRAQQFFQNADNEQVRFDYTTMSGDWATTSVNSVTAYWVRVRITTAITTVPVLQRIKLHVNRTEINSDGFIEFFGIGQPTLPLVLHQRLTDSVSGSTPSNQDIAFASGITLSMDRNRFTANATDEFGWVRRVVSKQDTSRPITFNAIYRNTNTDTGNILFRFVYALLEPGDVWDGTTASTTLTQTVAGTGTTNQSNTVTFTFSIPDALPGDVIAFKFGRVGGDASDTYTGSVDVGLIEADGYAWSV